MNIRIFRKFKTKIWFSKNGVPQSDEIVINLFDIEDYSSVNDKSEYPSAKHLTLIYLSSGVSYFIEEDFNLFDKLMDNFLIDYKLLDERSQFKKRPMVYVTDKGIWTPYN